MKNRIFLYLLLLNIILLIMIPKNSLSQKQDWIFYHSGNTGLPQNNVYKILQDQKENMWFGTHISSTTHRWPMTTKFDGIKWTVYSYLNPVNFDSLYLEIIDVNDNLWFSSIKGAFKYNGTILTRYDISNSGLPNNYVTAISQDFERNIWFATRGDIRISNNFLIAKYDGTNWTVYDQETTGIRKDSYISVITPDENGNIWFGTTKSGVMKFDGSNWTTYDTTNSGLPSNNIHAITSDKNGNVWFGTVGSMYFYEGGAAKYDGTNWTVYDTSNSGLPSNDILTITIDKNDNIWFGTDEYNGYRGGAVKYDGTNWTVYNTSNSVLPTNDIESISTDKDGNIWFAAKSYDWRRDDGGAVKYDGTNWTVYKVETTGLPGAVTGVTQDNNGNFWFSSYSDRFSSYYFGGAVKFDGTKWTIYDILDTILPNKYTRSVTADKNGNIWFGANGNGAYRGSVAKYDGSNWTKTLELGLYTRINIMTTDTNGNMWIGHRNGAARFDGIDWTFYDYPDLPSDDVRAIAQDSSGNIWFGTNGQYGRGGAAKYDGSNWTYFDTLNSGLPSNNVNAITTDSDGNIWFGTDEGAARFDSTDWIEYNWLNSGLPDNNVLAITPDSYGNIWFGTEEGAARFDSTDWTVFNYQNTKMYFGNVSSIFEDRRGNIWLINGAIMVKICNPYANFNYISFGSNVSFINESERTENYFWDFGDGYTDTIPNPKHMYSSKGNYNVMLISSNSYGSDTIIRPIHFANVQDYNPKNGGNVGDLTMNIYGHSLNEKIMLKLSDDNENIFPDTIIVESPNNLVSIFNLYGKKAGKRDLIIEFPGDTTIIFHDGFVIEEGGEPNIWVDIIGRPQIRPGRAYKYELRYGNNGNVDAICVPILLSIIGDSTFEIDTEFNSISKTQDNQILGNNMNILTSGVFGHKYISIDYTNISANSVNVSNFSFESLVTRHELNFYLKTGVQNKQILTRKDEKKKEKVSTAVIECLKNEAFEKAKDVMQMIYELEGEIDDIYVFYKCFNDFMMENLYNKSFKNKETFHVELLRLRNILNDALMDCGSEKLLDYLQKFGEEFVARFSEEIVKALADPDGLSECWDIFEPEDFELFKIEQVISKDPNEMVGPSSNHKNNYRRSDVAFPYSIFFENLDSATAPAQEVLIIDTLNKDKFVLSTFQFSSISFGDKIINVPPGLKEYTMDLGIKNKDSLIVRINAKLDTLTSIVKWHFISIDPETRMLTEDPLAGLLPPNVSPPEGEGYVSYSIYPKKGLNSGTVIKNKATIIFDVNKPVITNEWLNTIDNDNPTSRVHDLGATQGSVNFNVNWIGEDQTSGSVEYYNIYYSENSSTFTLWKYRTTETSAEFIGEPNSTYGFYSIAIDYAGNEEIPKETADATTLITSLENEIIKENAIFIYPNPLTDKTKIRYCVNQTSSVCLTITNSFGIEVARLIENKLHDIGDYSIDFNSEQLPSGLYFCRLTVGSEVFTRKFIILK